MAEGDDENNVYFKFRFNKAQLFNNLLKVPVEYEVNIQTFMENVTAAPVTNFDDLFPYDYVLENG